jgi:HK97 family phage portal protein
LSGLGLGTSFYAESVASTVIETIDKAASTNTAQSVSSGAFALTPDYLSFRNTWFGQPQPVTYKIIWKAYQEDPIIRACTDITVDAIIGDGYTLTSKSKEHIEKVNEVIKKSGDQIFLHDLVTSLVLYGDGFSENVRKGNMIDFFKPADSSTVRIDYDEHGEIVKYIQRVLHRRVDFYPDEMTHFTMNNVGGRVYGMSWTQSVIYTLQNKQSAQEFNNMYFRRPGLPRSIYMVKNLGKEQVDRMVAELRKATPQTDILINAQMGEVTHTLVSPNNQDMQFIELMNFDRQEIIAASGVPPIFLGITEGSNRANAQTQMESWDRRKKKNRMIIEGIINNTLLTLANFGFDDVKFRFKDENSRERLKYAQMAQLTSTIKWATPNQVLQMLGYPTMEDDETVYDSSTGVMDFKTSEQGDRPIYEIEQEIAEEKQKLLMESQPAGKGSITNPNAANPQKSQTKSENAERLNSEQANETRSNKFKKSPDPFLTYPYKAVEPEREVTDPDNWRQMKERLQFITEAQIRVMLMENYEYDERYNGKQGKTPLSLPTPGHKSTDGENAGRV